MAQECLWIYPEKKDLSPEFIKVAGSRIIAQLLTNRGISSPEEARAFLDIENMLLSSPDVFADMEKAVNRVNQAIGENEHIVIYGDFDADGVTSTSLLYRALKHLNANVSYYIPDRSDEGHGLNSGSVCRLISTKKAKLIITVDCGISNHVEINLAKGLGTDVIVTDHHESPETPPPAYAIINPKAPDNITDLNIYENIKYLAGVGVAYKFAQALLKSNNKSDYLDEILYLVAVGTIADVVPLLGENRALVYRGLKLISKNRPSGIIKLLEIAGCKIENGISSEMIAFAIAPRINAVGRLAEASLAVELLTSDDPEETTIIAKKLNYENRNRQQICESTFIEADGMVTNEVDLENNKAIILANPNWHPGIIGIVASKLVEKYNRPVFLMAIDKENNEARCSARSIEGLHLYEVLNLHADLFNHFGGHALAAGFGLNLEKITLEAFIELLNTTVNENIDPSGLESSLNIDVEIESEDLTIDFVDELNKLAPFGEGNPSPVFSISNLILKEYKTMGQAKNHLKLVLSDSSNNPLEAVWWQKSSLEVSVLDSVDVAFSPRVNFFAGKTTIQLDTKALRLDSKNKISSDRTVMPSLQSSSLNTSTNPKWIDHRQRTGIERVFSNYLKTCKGNVVIFAESRETLQLLKQDSAFESRIISRLNVDKVDQLILFDLPPNKNVLFEILDKSEAKIIHLVGMNNTDADPKQLIKTLSGMLKFAYSNRDGIININEIASKLCSSDEVVSSCVKLLNMAGVINITEKINNIVRFNFNTSTDMSSVINLKEYNLFLESVTAVEKFHKQLSNYDIDQIKEIIFSQKEVLV